MTRPVATYDVTSITTGVTVTMTTNRDNITDYCEWWYEKPDGTWVRIADLVGYTTTWNFPLATFAPLITTKDSYTIVLHVEYYTSADVYRFRSDKSMKLTLDAGANPTISDIGVVETVSAVNTKVGKFVKGLSNLQVAINGAAGLYGATIVKNEVVFNGVSYPSSVLTTGIISTSGSVLITGRITDSRGRITTLDRTITILDYSPPSITSFAVPRCDSGGTLLVTGTYGEAASVASVSSLVNGTEKNNLSYTINSRVRGTSPWTLQKSATLGAGVLSLNATDVIGSNVLAPTSAYEFQLAITDQFNTTVTMIIMTVAAVTLSLNKTGIGVGKVWQRGAIDAAGRVYDLTGFIYPVGAITPFAGSTAPDGFLIANGAAVSRTTYADLFAVIGATYGGGDGSTTFNLPNLKGRVIVGQDAAQTEFDTLAETGGEKAHAMTAAENGTHTHAATTYGELSGTDVQGSTSTVNGVLNAGGSNYYVGGPTSAVGTTQFITTISAQGSGTAHNNLQPYVVMPYIIKY